MNHLASLFLILLKSSFLSTLIFWMMITEDFGIFFPIAILISMIPITIISSFTILISILPIVRLNKQDSFKKYFPYYSIVVFCGFTYLIVESNFDEFISAFLVSAFFTLMQAWVWICESQLNPKNNDITFE
ncbi:hypothetical protein [Psychroflexus aestuariivivens]|uniref:hypothetical protein n=1 Tax=Psychroflexus aestuariivivens TaxID=1795040 RepID=UPI000FDBC6CD|nr:hypothetical protein [Psychroflexus aestuariivivens]